MTESLRGGGRKGSARELCGGEWRLRSRGHGNVHFDVHVVAGDDLLPANGADLDLDVHNPQRFSADVDLHKTWIDGLVELTEP